MKKIKKMQENIKEKVNLKDEFNFLSIEDANEFKRIATGRKFCKKGERIIDICTEEIKRYKYNNSRNIFVKIFKYQKFQKCNVGIIETRLSSNIRAMTQVCINDMDNDCINIEALANKVKQTILEKVAIYQ